MSYNRNFFCWSMAMVNKNNYNEGDKIILPMAEFSLLQPDETGGPICLKIKNPKHDGFIHVGVLEFSTVEGNCHLPHWLMFQLLLDEGDPVEVSRVSNVSSAEFVKMRPQTQEFLQLTDPKAVLEVALRKFTYLTVNSWICIRYCDNDYFLDVIELRPGDVACVLDTDCILEFENSEGVKQSDENHGEVKSTEEELISEPVRRPTKKSKNYDIRRFPGKGYRLGNGSET